MSEQTDMPTADDTAKQIADVSEVQDTTEEERPRRELMTLVSILLLVVLVILVLLMLRGCGSTSGLDTRGAKTITSVEGAEPLDGVISVWVEEGTNLTAALSKAGVSHEDIADLGDGRYLVVVSQGVERDAARRLAAQPGVYDVGLVYESE